MTTTVTATGRPDLAGVSLQELRDAWDALERGAFAAPRIDWSAARVDVAVVGAAVDEGVAHPLKPWPIHGAGLVVMQFSRDATHGSPRARGGWAPVGASGGFVQGYSVGGGVSSWRRLRLQH